MEKRAITDAYEALQRVAREHCAREGDRNSPTLVAINRAMDALVRAEVEYELRPLSSAGAATR